MIVNVNFLGEGFLAAVFFLSAFVAASSLIASKLKPHLAAKVLCWAKTAMLITAALSVVLLILLTVAFLTDDFSIAVVEQYSSKDLPFFYKLSALWAGSAGSLLLWSAALFVMFALWLARTKIEDPVFNATVLYIGAGVCLGFSALLLFVAKPFAISAEAIDNGAGLNPLLRNFWMIIHPPLLFIGYSAFLVPFAIASASVFTGRTADIDIYRQLRRWLLFGICFLSLGIATGARWSYIELGWGGYWGWDPVESASLLPWFLAVAALHGLVGMRFSEKFRFWTMVLLPLPFILCLVAAFIARSGALQSVHAFDRNVMFSALLTFIACCFLLWLICVIRAAKSIPVSRPQLGTPILNKVGLLFWSDLIFVVVAAIIGVATFLPVIWQVFTGSILGFVITRAFYDNVISGTGAILAFLLGLVALTDLQKRPGFVLQELGSCAAGLISYGIVFKVFETAFLVALACGVCVFSFVAIIINICVNFRAGSRIGSRFSHLGLLLLVVAAGFSSTERAIQTQLARGRRMMFGGRYEFLYNSFVRKPADGIVKEGPEIIVRKKGLTKKLWPHSVLYPDGQRTAEVAVYTGLFEDVYISFGGVDQDGRVTIAAKIKPLMFWLWLAALLVIAGLALGSLQAGRNIKLKAESLQP